MSNYRILYDPELRCSIRTTSDQVGENLKKSHPNIIEVARAGGRDCKVSDGIDIPNYNHQEYIKLRKDLEKSESKYTLGQKLWVNRKGDGEVNSVEYCYVIGHVAPKIYQVALLNRYFKVIDVREEDCFLTSEDPDKNLYPGQTIWLVTTDKKDSVDKEIEPIERAKIIEVVSFDPLVFKCLTDKYVLPYVSYDRVTLKRDIAEEILNHKDGKGSKDEQR